MNKMLFEFDYRGYTIYCVADFFDSFVDDCRTVHIDFLWKEYVHSTSFIIHIDFIEDVHFLQSHIFKTVSKYIDSLLNELVVFKRIWNMHCDSVPRVYQFEKEVLFSDSKVKKIPR